MSLQESFFHGLAKLVRGLGGDGHDGGPGATEEGTDGPGTLGLKNGLSQAWDKRGAVGLVKTIVKRADRLLISPFGTSRGNAGDIAQIGDSVSQRDLRGKE